MPYAAARRTLALAAALAAFGAGAQTMYKWVDEKGVTHYSQDAPPDDRKATKVTPRVTPPSNPQAPSDDWKGREADSKRRQVERAQKEKVDEKEAAKRAQLCEQWKGRVTFLQDGRIYRDNPDGTRSFLDESQRASEIAKAKERVSENCR